MFETNLVQFQTIDEETASAAGDCDPNPLNDKIIMADQRNYVADIKMDASSNVPMPKEKDIASNEKIIDFDDLLPYAGEFGLYQVFLFASTLPFYFYFAFVYFSQIFLTETPQEHWCWVPELENLTALERRTLAIPQHSSNGYGYSRCAVYDANWTQVLTALSPPDLSTPTVKCQYGWEYSMSDIPYPTASSEMDWVCERDNYQAIAQSVFFVGAVVGSLIFGWVSDRFGRIPVTVLTNLVGCIGGIATAYAQNFWQFTLTRFIVGLAYDNCVMMIYILVLEYTAPKYRTAMSNISFASFYTIAACALPWISLACGHWRIIALATSVPMALALFTPFVIPESPRWLLSKGKVEAAIQKLRTIARVNGKVLPENMINEFRTSSLKAASSVEKISLLDLFKTPALRRTFILICLEYMLTSIVFDCLVRVIGSLGSDLFLSFTIASLTEFPSLILLVFVMDWLGRRWMTSGCFMISCVFSLLSAFVPKGSPSLACTVIARFTSNMSFNGVIQWAPELLPSGARGSGTAFIHMCGYLATILAPYIIYLENVRPYLPQVVIGAVAACGGVIALLIAETAGRVMPQTCARAELMITEQSFWDMPFRRKTRRNTENEANSTM